MFLRGWFIVPHGIAHRIVYQMVPLTVMTYHTIDSTPVRETTQVTVINKYINLQFPREVGIVISSFFWIVTINGIELHTSLTTPVHGVVQQLTFTHTPQDYLMSVLTEHLQRLNGKRYLLANLRISVFYNCTIKIYCYCHFLIELSSLFP